MHRELTRASAWLLLCILVLVAVHVYLGQRGSAPTVEVRLAPGDSVLVATPAGTLQLELRRSAPADTTREALP